MNADDTFGGESDGDTVDDDYAPELDMGALGDDEDMEGPIDPPVVPGGRDNSRVPEEPDIDDLDDGLDERPARPLTDDEITARVIRLLRSDAATSMLRIHVTTEDGVVTLQGSVQTLDDTDNAAEVASRVREVVDVLDELDVEP